jgi:hypothetical protein
MRSSACNRHARSETDDRSRVEADWVFVDADDKPHEGDTELIDGREGLGHWWV